MPLRTGDQCIRVNVGGCPVGVALCGDRSMSGAVNVQLSIQRRGELDRKSVV